MSGLHGSHGAPFAWHVGPRTQPSPTSALTSETPPESAGMGGGTSALEHPRRVTRKNVALVLFIAIHLKIIWRKERVYSTNLASI